MSTLTRNQQLLIGGFLLLAMILTRGGLVNHIQDMSWAVFFIAGFYLRKYIAFPVFFLAALAVDLVVIKVQGGDNYCFTPSYAMLVPAYFSMWFAGRWLSTNYREDARGLLNLAGAAIIGTAACFLISNAGFYAFSGRFGEMSMLEYVSHVDQYMPMYMQTTLLYVGAAALLHVAVGQTRKLTGHSSHS
ncbi:MAG: Unknown protein [uncultured Thiotrichaceae bacterium]|uniref:Cobalamin ABC transporter n=1 Tax=uncultured Thiotrichaceae bacterium TaxID=298394 RepID=A0A6S6UDQ8_9GAMM|nr:MAG: Unknown protein [uncultured Thiotrichaceae bacterium]